MSKTYAISLDAILRKIRNVTVNRDYEIPYVAGYSEDGETVYVDKHLPLTYKQSNGRQVDVLTPLLVHEVTEKYILKTYGVKYQFAHEAASHYEHEYVKRAGFDKAEYDEFFKKWIKTIADLEKKSAKMPADLDLEPYEDSKDKATLHAMKEGK